MDHICVCICTYKRPHLLDRLLESLREQKTGGRFTYSIVIADNDSQRSAEAVASAFAASSRVPLQYCMEPRRSVSFTRNRALENATGNYIAFIDDDEFAPLRWLLTLYEACNRDGVAGVMGPVDSYFDQEPPEWVRKGKFYQHSAYPTGTVVVWTTARTGNVLFKREILPEEEQPFRPQFQGGGADQDFFRRLMERGHVFVWSSEAVTYEAVPPVRWKRSFMLRRALLRGYAARLQPTFGGRDLLKSLVAVPAYLLVLPVALALGHHRFMALLVKSCDHLGKVLASVGIRPVKQPYVTE
ncbi:MAG: glycosyltransferase family 2 protein [Terriglobia bacterium]